MGLGCSLWGVALVGKATGFLDIRSPRLYPRPIILGLHWGLYRGLYGGYIGVILGLHRDYIGILGLYWGYIGSQLPLISRVNPQNCSWVLL